MTTTALASRSVRAARASVPVTGALAASAAIVAAIVLALGADPGTVVRTMVDSALGSDFAFGQTIMVASLLTLTGLAAVIPFTARLSNIGGEGQLFFGAFSGYAAARLLPLPGLMLPLAVLVAGALGGAVWGLVPGVLKAVVDANEVITSLMMSFIAILLAGVAVNHLWPEGFGAQTQDIPADAALPMLWPGAGIDVAAPVALAAAVATWVVMTRTRLGFEIRAAGLNARAARANGIDVRRMPILTFAGGGACAGLAGAIAVAGVNGALVQNFSQSYGFLGVAVALLARLNGLLVLPAALLFAVLTVGGNGLEVSTGLSADVGQILGGVLVVLLVAFKVIRRRYPEGDRG